MNDITTPAPIVIKEKDEEGSMGETEAHPESENAPATEAAREKIPVKVKGIYLTANVAGSEARMDDIIKRIDETEINAVVIDFKDDGGRITCQVNSPVVDEIDACQVAVKDMPGLIRRLKEHGIYTIARIVAFRDPYLAEKKPDWCMKLPDGAIFRDRNGLAWINPYKKEVWDYLVEVGLKAAETGFDEVQFDYIRFCTERGVGDVVFHEEDTKGRSKTDVITEFAAYAYEKLSERNVFVAADVFGGIISSRQDAEAVGQIYGDMAGNLDYICPMIYPSHYSDGYFGIDHPDMDPYGTIKAALKGSSSELRKYRMNGVRQASVRPWLQDFTASYLEHYIPYGPKEVREQIQAVYDAGYDEWILWSASSKYSWEGLKTPEEAEEESRRIAESRAALSEEEREEEGLTGGGTELTGPAPELTGLPELPEYVAPAGPSESEETETVNVIIPQMHMD